MSDILDKAALVVNQEMNPGAAVDIDTIFNIGTTIYNLIKSCREKNAQGMIKAAKREGLLLRISLRQHVDPGLPKRETVDAMLNACANAKPDELQKLIDDVRGV